MEKNNHILVTGAAGFIGFHFAERLLKDNFNVIGIDDINDYYDVELKKARLKILSKYKSFTFIKLDFSKTLQFKKIEKYNFSKIVHLGAQAGVRYSIDNPMQYATSNFIGTLNIYEFAKRKNINHIILASTSSVYGDSKETILKESDETDHPLSFYSATKKSTELLAHSYLATASIRTTILRFFTVYGPWGRPDMALFKFIKNIENGKTINVYNNGIMKRSFTYIDDIVDGISSAMRIKKDFSVYNLGGAKSIKLMDFIKIIEKVLNKKAKINFMPMQIGDMKETVADTSLAFRDLKFNPKVDVTVGIENTVKWYKENKSFLDNLKEAKQ
jgi:UDP-glucuronate 4-epimerase